jgi:hypothetical protein
MYLDFLVKIPDAQGKMTRRKKGDAIYIEYAYDQVYHPEKQYTTVSRATIGVCCIM